MIEKIDKKVAEEVEKLLADIIGNKTTYSWMDIISCCMVINQKTIKNIKDYLI